jgi:hypothetical protein
MGLSKITGFAWNTGVDNLGVAESTNIGLGKALG